MACAAIATLDGAAMSAETTGTTILRRALHAGARAHRAPRHEVARNLSEHDVDVGIVHERL